ncbi:MAG: hypothetical protein IKK21_00495 [Clostridia bacterium]|nr:hypothetical protein [Clostridia bacterium]
MVDMRRRWYDDEQDKITSDDAAGEKRERIEMRKSGSAVRIRLCAVLLLVLGLIAGISLLSTGIHAVTEGNKLERAVGQNQIAYGIACILGGVILRELVNGFSTIVAAHESKQQVETPFAAVPASPASEKKKKNWTCRQCRTKNAPSRDTCEGCGTRRETLKASQQEEPAPAVRKRLSFWEQMAMVQKTTWTCPEWGRENTVSVGSCEGCGAGKPRQY